MILNENVDRKIIPIAGGKGGVGKSLVAVNTAVSIAMNGKKVILIDLDLGGSNVHTLLGEKNIKQGIGNFISGLKCHLEKLVCPTMWENLFYIPGDGLVCGIGELPKSVKVRIMKEILELDADYILIDLGGGTSFNVLDFFLISNSGFVVTIPQATSVLNTYSFLKNYVFQFLRRVFAGNREISLYLKRVLKERRPNERATITKVFQEIGEKDSAAREKAEAFIDVLQPKLILNKIEDSSDITVVEGLRDLCKQNLCLNLECLGTVMNSTIAANSADRCKPFVFEFPEEVVSGGIQRISQKIIQSVNFPEMPLELDYYSDSFELAHIETENDFMALKQNAEVSGNSNNYDESQLLELIKLQQGKIQELQGALRRLSIGQEVS